MATRLERHQVWAYVAAIAVGAAIGLVADGRAEVLDAAVPPALVALLFVTFVQVHLERIRAAVADTRFLVVAVLANFVAVPVVVWALLPLVGDDPAVRLGVMLVLLAPCTDWFITFTHLAGGDTGRAITLTPVNLVLQLTLLPFYLWLLGAEITDGVVTTGSAFTAFATLIALPLVAAMVLRARAARRPRLAATLDRLAPAAVPLVAVVVALIAASQVDVVIDALDLIPRLTVAYVAFASLALLLAVALGRAAGLPGGSTRTLAFSVGTRNSFVVLPFALALGAGYEVAVVVVVYQSLVELLAMAVYLRVVPRVIPVAVRGSTCMP